MENDSGKSYVGGTARKTDLELVRSSLKGSTKAGSRPFRAKTALTLAILDVNVAIVPTSIRIT